MEEIEEATFQEDAPIYIGDMEVDGYVRASRVKEIIRAHMDEAKDTNVPSNDDDYTMFTQNEDGVAEIYCDTYDIIIHCESSEEQKRVGKILEHCKDWIPVEERLPEAGEKVIVTVHTSDWIVDYNSAWVRDEEKTYHPEEYNVYEGYLCRNGTWIFYDKDNTEVTCAKEFGYDKGCVYDVVTAWMPIIMPTPYNIPCEKKNILSVGADHIMSRFTKVE